AFIRRARCLPRTSPAARLLRSSRASKRTSNRRTEMTRTFSFDLDLSQHALRELVPRAQQGDRAAFGELFRRYERAVLATALRRLGNEAEAQELCQEVFVQALRKLHQLREPECLGAWLRSMTTRMAINRAV